MFQVSYDRDWHFFEVAFFIILGIFGGLYGEFVIKWNLRAQAFRKKYLKQYAISEVVFLAAITAVICWWNMFLRIDMTETMERVFRECEGKMDYNELCEYERFAPYYNHLVLLLHIFNLLFFSPFFCVYNVQSLANSEGEAYSKEHRWSMVFSLLLACVIRLFLVIISYGCKVPAGIFVPSMAIGATFGRMVGILVQALHEANPQSRFFASCQPDVPVCFNHSFLCTLLFFLLPYL